MFVHGSGSPERPAIVFLHANGSNGSMWKTHMAQLADYHCLAPDFPGYGQSSDQPWVSLDETAQRVIELIRNRTAHGRSHIAGLSLGGSMAITLLGKAPELIDHAIVDGAGVLPLPGVRFTKMGFRILQPFLKTGLVIKTLARLNKIPAEGYAGFRQNMLAMSPAAFTRSFSQALSLQQPPGLERVACPALFVAGEGEPQAVRQSNALLATTLPNAQCRVAPGMRHGWLAEAPELHIRMVRAWIEDEPLPTQLVGCGR